MAYDNDVRHVIRHNMTKEKYLTLSQASAYTGLSHRTLQRYVASGKLTSTKNGSGVRQISERLLKPYVKVEFCNKSVEQGALKEVLLEMLELIRASDVSVLTRKQKLREMVHALAV